MARKVLHKTVTVSNPEDYIDVEQAKELLGWIEAEDGEKPLKEFNFAVGKRKVFLANNISNRPISKGNYDSLIQEILRCRWMFNGESIIIGRTGLILNGQHTLIALVLAAEIHNESPDLSCWTGEEPYIDKIIVYGVDEGDAVVNTMDTCRPRSLADVLYRSTYFKSLKLTQAHMKKVARIGDFCVRTLWHRTGVCYDAFSASKRTHSEALDFIDRHSKLVDCVAHIFNEDTTEKKISKLIPCGTAAGLLYMMASSKTPFHEYYTDEAERNESTLDWSNQEKAEEFWTLLAGRAPEFQKVMYALAEVSSSEDSTSEEVIAVIVKAWNLFLSGKKMSTEKLKLEYHTDDDGFRKLAECPTVGGIDQGKPEEPEAEYEDEESEEEQQVKRQGKLLEGEEVWVKEVEEPEGHWKGTIKELYPSKAVVAMGNGYKGAGKTYECKLEHLFSVET
tara:strand:- start:119 stop:1465 length:1347 start_codon:yes stop_codon:yes gene_type:complete